MNSNRGDSSKWRSFPLLIISIAAFSFIGQFGNFLSQIEESIENQTLKVANYSTLSSTANVLPTSSHVVESETSSSLKKPDQISSPKKIGKKDGSFSHQFPIYMSNPHSNQVSPTSWETLFSEWDRETQYADLWKHATKSTTDSQLIYPHISKEKRIAVIFHTSPKTGSSTLRKACMENLNTTCGIPLKEGKDKQPQGYRSPSVLSMTIQNCTSTQHFCVKEQSVAMLSPLRPTIEFMHMFPFRHYNEWVVSALNQISFRDGEKGCIATEKLLKKCQPHKYELDFGKYGKTRLKKFIKELKAFQRLKEGKDDYTNHHIFLYDYERTDETLLQLSVLYGIPHLPGMNKKVNSHGLDETCKNSNSIVETFHECFSSQLGKMR